MERRVQSLYKTEASYPTVYDREQTLNEIINTCTQLKREYIAKGVTPTAKAWEKILTDFHLPLMKQFQVADLQERRVVDILSPRFPNVYLEETFDVIEPHTVNS